VCGVADIAVSAANDPATAASFAELGNHLGLALRMAFAGFAPDVVVLGGGIVRSAHLFLSVAQRQLEGLNLDLRVSALRDKAHLIGAAVAWFNGSPDHTVRSETTLAE
jgi:glucokinase